MHLPDTEQLIYTAEEFRKIMRLSKNTFYRMVKEGYLPAPIEGSRKMIWPKAGIDRFLMQAGFR